MPSVDIQDFVSKLRCCSEAEFADVPRIHQLLRDNPVDPQSIDKYLVWDSQHYTRNLIDKTPLFEIMAICWDVGQFSAIHNHQDQNCWMMAPKGRLMVQNYRVLRQDLKAGTSDLQATDRIEMNSKNPCAVDPNNPVHKVYNPCEFGARAVSVHVYSRPYHSCVVYSDENHRCGEIELAYTSEYGLVHR